MRFKSVIIFGVTNSLFLFLVFLISCQTGSTPVVQIQAKSIQIDFDQFLHSRVLASTDNGTKRLGDFAPSEFITVVGNDITDFTYKEQLSEDIEDNIGQ